ncbi:MAG TPA: DUF4010 domain-containing protein, partial [Vicinamibacterales bacterium]|nr:DUF4010 domain-containing protein [Vicinamibacterales bacterium]
AVLNAPLLPLAIRYLAPPALVVAVALAISARSAGRRGSPPRPSRNPLAVVAALQMASIFQVVLILVRAAQERWGTSGVLTTAAVLGLTDVDALTLSMARGLASLDTAALAITVGVLANTVLKAVTAVSFGDRRFGFLVAGTLLASAAAGGIAIVLQ